MQLSQGDRVHMQGISPVAGLERGFEYRMTQVREIQGSQVYVLKCEDTGEYSKIPVRTVDDLIKDEDIPLKVI